MARKITYPARYPTKVQFARSVVVWDIIFVSGCSGQTLQTFRVASNDVVEQTFVALDKVRSAIEEAGSDMNHLVKTTLYLTNIEDYPRVEEARQKYYEKFAPELINNPPADSVIAIKGLHQPDMLVEIDSVAVR